MPDFLNDLFVYGYWRRAVIGGILLSVICSYLSVYVVLKRMAFIGQGISHSALGGFALGVFLFSGTAAADAKIYAVALLFCLAVAFMIASTTRHSKLSEDSAIGIFFVASMALGIIFFKATPGFNQDVTTFLFGSVMMLNKTDLLVVSSMAPIIVLILASLHKELLFYTFDEEMASVSGIPVTILHYLLLSLLSMTIIISARMLGILLVSAFLILPGAIALLLVQRFVLMIFTAIGIGLVTTCVGMVISNIQGDWPAGASIVLVQFAVFLLVFVIRKAQGALSV